MYTYIYIIYTYLNQYIHYHHIYMYIYIHIYIYYIASSGNIPHTNIHSRIPTWGTTTGTTILYPTLPSNTRPDISAYFNILVSLLMRASHPAAPSWRIPPWIFRADCRNLLMFLVSCTLFIFRVGFPPLKHVCAAVHAFSVCYGVRYLDGHFTCIGMHITLCTTCCCFYFWCKLWIIVIILWWDKKCNLLFAEQICDAINKFDRELFILSWIEVVSNLICFVVHSLQKSSFLFTTSHRNRWYFSENIKYVL